MAKSDFEAVIGLEVHAQLRTASKLFCSDAVSFGASPNTLVSEISLAHPGTLPVMNEEAIRLAVRLGLAMNCAINSNNFFARKHYFYPDLPKGYQVSQDTEPICKGGYLMIETSGGEKKVQLNRIHMEEDAGKSIHDAADASTCIDLNRAGTPLLEIVTEPDMHSAEEAAIYVTELRKLVRWLNVCDGNMEEGSLRCDANVSVRSKGSTTLGTRVEIKNLNSIKNLHKAIELEVDRLVNIIEIGGTVVQETRSYDADSNTSFSMRGKEDAHDYRYFPDPDLAPFRIDEAYVLEAQAGMPELPNAVRAKLTAEFGLSDYDASQLCGDRSFVDLFFRLTKNISNFKAIANWLNGPVKNYCAEKNANVIDFPLNSDQLAKLIAYTETGAVHYNAASTRLLTALIAKPGSMPEVLAAELDLVKNDDATELEKFIEEAIAAMPGKWAELCGGKKNLIGLFAGQVKQLSKGKADMEKTNRLLLEKSKQS